MQLILAIDSDPRRSEQLANLVRARLSVDLVQAASAGEGLHALKDRIPDLILTAPLLSPFDDGVLDEYLRDLGAAAAHVQTLRIPMLSSGPRKKSAAGRLFLLGRKKNQTSSAAPDGCDPKVFADEIAHYLTRSLEERSASAHATADRSSSADATVITTPDVGACGVFTQPVADEWGVPETLVEEFRESDVSIAAPMPLEPVVEPVFEERHVPGSILDLRPPIVHTPQPRVIEPEPVVVEPEPVLLEPEPLLPEPEPAWLRPEPVFIRPEPLFVEPEHAEMHPAVKAFLEPEPPAPVEPKPFDSAQGRPFNPTPVEPEPPVIAKPTAAAAIATAKPASTPPSSTTAGTSASFEAALAAIRAAWEKPAPKTPAPAQPATPAAGARPLAASGEVDLTNDIDALEDVASVDSTVPAAGGDDSPDESKTPNARRNADKPRKRPEKPRGRKTRGADGRDDWGVLDPNQYEFSALVNKLDEVTDGDEVTTRATNSR